MIVVVAIILALLGLVLPAVSSMWEQRKGAQTEAMLRGLLMTARAQARHDKERGLFFMLEGDVQRVFPIEAEPFDPFDDLTDPQDDVSLGLTEASAVNRFTISDGKVVTLPRPFRVAPREVVDTTVWSFDEINRQDYAEAHPANELQRHRNFFAMIFSPDGRLLVGRNVLIHDPSGRTGLDAADCGNWDAGSGPVPFPPGGATLCCMLREATSDIALNFPGVDGLLVYDESLPAGLPAVGSGRQDLMIRIGQPLYVSRLSGQVIRGPLGENE